MIRTAIVGFGNVGYSVYEAIKAAGDISLDCIVTRNGNSVPDALKSIWVDDIKDINKFGQIDVAVLCRPSRLCPDTAKQVLEMGINCVDSFDIHNMIWDTKCMLNEVAKKHGKACVISAGWDPGTDSMIRAIFEAMAPKGISYTNFGPGMSMGHTVAVKAIDGVKAALSVTIPLGTGIHRRMVYIELAKGFAFDEVAQRIKTDEYFAHDETHVIAVENVDALIDMGHGVNLTRKGVSGGTCNQIFEFNMKINNPALTAQILVCSSRAVMKRQPGCYTMIELPPIDMLEGKEEDLIKRLV